jgi:hypothetical protein
LVQADVGLALAIHSGTNTAKEAVNLIDLDSDPTKLIDLVWIGKQMLMGPNAGQFNDGCVERRRETPPRHTASGSRRIWLTFSVRLRANS